MTTTAPNFVVDIEMSLTQEELENLVQLADMLNKTVDVVARMCMNERCKELIDLMGTTSGNTECLT